jgi:hypothetical protein
MTTFKFFYNGIKANGGKLQFAYYDDCPLRSYPAGTITIRARGYRGFSPEIAGAFKIENNTDMQTDYFEKDCIRVLPTHDLYPAVHAALLARRAHYAKRYGQAA